MTLEPKFGTNNVHWSDLMRIYVFKSDLQKGLRAFTADLDGSKLPPQFQPWHAVGVIASDKDPPHHLPRKAIEKAIEDCGFQLWRRLPNQKPA